MKCFFLQVLEHGLVTHWCTDPSSLSELFTARCCLVMTLTLDFKFQKLSTLHYNNCSMSRSGTVNIRLALWLTTTQLVICENVLTLTFNLKMPNCHQQSTLTNQMFWPMKTDATCAWTEPGLQDYITVHILECQCHNHDHLHLSLIFSASKASKQKMKSDYPIDFYGRTYSAFIWHSNMSTGTAFLHLAAR